MRSIVYIFAMIYVHFIVYYDCSSIIIGVKTETCAILSATTVLEKGSIALSKDINAIHAIGDDLLIGLQVVLPSWSALNIWHNYDKKNF
jgi:hypothetical protein